MSSTKWINNKTGENLMIGSQIRNSTSAGSNEEVFHAEVREVFQPYAKLPEDPANPERVKHLNPNNIHCKITLTSISNINSSLIENIVFPVNMSVQAAGLLWGNDALAGRPCRFVCDPFRPEGGRVEIVQGVHQFRTPQSKTEEKLHGNNTNTLQASISNVIGRILDGFNV